MHSYADATKRKVDLDNINGVIKFIKVYLKFISLYYQF